MPRRTLPSPHRPPPHQLEHVVRHHRLAALLGRLAQQVLRGAVQQPHLVDARLHGCELLRQTRDRAARSHQLDASSLDLCLQRALSRRRLRRLRLQLLDAPQQRSLLLVRHVAARPRDLTRGGGEGACVGPLTLHLKLATPRCPPHLALHLLDLELGRVDVLLLRHGLRVELADAVPEVLRGPARPGHVGEDS